MNKPTDWYQGWQKPLRPGTYQRDITALINPALDFTFICRERWSGDRWEGRFGDASPHGQNLPWRGLSAPQGE